ncbi:MAG: transglycosylase domain-containing protein [Pseudomonadota bacterium]
MSDLLDFAATLVTAATPLISGPVGPLEIPDIDRLMSTRRTQAESIVTYADGSFAGTTAGRLSRWSPLDELPPLFLQALQASEDARFYDHHGVDLLAVARATADWASSGRLTSGGSTITQQVIKNVLLDASQSFDRKILEIMLAVQLEEIFDKDEIFEVYVNAIYFGRGQWGAGDAAQAWFGRPWNELSVGEIAFLAGVIQAPSALDPNVNPDQAIARRDYVLNQMFENDVIDQATLDQALAEPLVASERVFEERTDTWVAHSLSRTLDYYVGTDAALRGGFVIETTVDPSVQQHTTEIVQEYMAGLDGFGVAGSTDLQDGLDETDWSVAQDVLPRVPVGWARGIVTAPAAEGMLTVALPDGTEAEIVLAEQQLSADAIAAAVEPGSIVALSPIETDSVEVESDQQTNAQTEQASDKETVASEDEESAVAEAPIEAPTQWRLESLPSRQVAVVIMEAETGNIRGLIGGYDPGLSEFDRSNAIRQPGSSIKPLLWLAALEAGLEYDQMVLDLPIEVQTADGRWQPANYGGDFVGTVPLFTALERSINLVAARLAYEIGVEPFASMAERAGAYPPGEMELVLSAALGSVGTTPVAMAGAYATLANEGVPVRPTLVHSIHDPLADRDVWQATPGWGQPSTEALPITEPESIDHLQSMMRGVTTRGTAARSFAAFGHPVAGKTGTSQDFRDAWFIGFTPEMVVAVWIGRDDNQPMGRGDAGGVLAAPLAAELFAMLYDDGVISEDANWTLLAAREGATEPLGIVDTGPGNADAGQFTGTGGLY